MKPQVKIKQLIQNGDGIYFAVSEEGKIYSVQIEKDLVGIKELSIVEHGG